MSLYMLELEAEPRPLYEWARQVGLPPRDRGYLVHSALRATFGKAAPQPFAIMGNERNPKLKILGYAPQGKGALLPGLALAEPVLAEAFQADAIRDKAMSMLASGTECGFHVTCCPITRCTMPNGKQREKDAFLAACDARPEGGVERADVYVAWLAAELARNKAAEMLDGDMRGFKLFVPVRRNTDGKAAKQTGRRPLATLSGVLRVKDAASFVELLARGVGRHRAFGLGMLLLRPV
jgi:CRISPR system Cascade subunit CasE